MHNLAIRKCTSPPLLAPRLKIFKLKFTTPPGIEPRTCCTRGRHATIWANVASLEPKLLKHISNRQLSELLIWEKNFIYKNKSAVATHFWSHKHKFEEEPKLLKHISNRPLLELLIWEKKCIYKNKEVAINLDIPQFNDFFKLVNTDNGRQRVEGVLSVYKQLMME